ncbi:complement factor B-like [Hoplias malabaricus]|uniref:complement factor B-like n=1 Tax=Hoplias malabaricus TaxID=27720 RepID=UPI0034635D35
MESVLCWGLVFFVMIGRSPLVYCAPPERLCSDSNLNITGGNFTLSNGYKEDSILKYYCPQGYYPYPTKKRECSSGKWTPVPSKRLAQCKRITCPNPNVLENVGVVEPYKPLYFVNDITTYRCYSDYKFRGSSTRVCQLNGKWNGSTPICSRETDHCPDPGTPPGTSRTGHIFNIDDKVTYRCDTTLTLLGSKVRVCQDDGQWSGREPECYAEYTYDTPEEVARTFGSNLKATLTTHEDKELTGKRIMLDQKGKLDIYIALDASDSIEKDDFNKAKEVIINLIDKISYYQVSPNYEIIIFTTEFIRIVSIADSKKEEEKALHKTIKVLEDFEFEAKGEKTGTNIAGAFFAILDSMGVEKAKNKSAFLETQHVIIMFTDGIYNMGGNPIKNVNEIKQLVYNEDEENRQQYLDIYVFGVGEDVKKIDIVDWVTEKPDEQHFFVLPNLDEVQQTFDSMLDESTSVGLCGLFRPYEAQTQAGHPWMVWLTVSHDEGIPSNCIGALVTPTFILTAAHCFKLGDLPNSIQMDIPDKRGIRLSAKDYIPHPDYKPRGKRSVGISEDYSYDVALIELKESVVLTSDFRPICIPCTRETSGAMRLTDSDMTCSKQKELLLKNDLTKSSFISAKKSRNIYPKNDVLIKQGLKMDACIEEAKKTLNISEEVARPYILDNFLCTGGAELNTIDEVSCQGDSGGAVFLEQKYRAIQVGVVSWGLNNLCKDDVDSDLALSTRDFQVDLFNPKVQKFLRLYLTDEKRGVPLEFLEM